jgi:nucleoside-diphosphate-sugar epimerase
MKNDRVLDITKCEQYLDYLYVDDISDLLIRLGKSKGVSVATLGSGKATQLKDIVEMICSITKSKSIINYGVLEYKTDQGMFNEADISKLSKTTGWKPKVSIEQGLSDMINKS